MSVPSAAPICGFDIGTENCYIGVAVKGGIEIVLNDYCLRSTPGYVCLLEKQRELGVAAKQKQNTNIQRTFYNLRRLIGRSYDEIMKDENLPFPVEKGPNGELFVRVFLLGEEHLLTATQLLAMVLTKLKQVSNNALECVINCPNYFTDCQKRELINAASIANIKTLKILPDLSAVALYYCFYRINTKEENNQILAFVDIGASSTQCAVVNFDPKKSSIQVLAVEYDNNLGGRNFDEALANYFIDQKKLNLNKRSKIRLLAECEKLKKQMSANSNVLPINVECLYEDTDFSSSMKRETFEELCTEYFDRIETVLQRALLKSNQAVFENSKKEEDKVSNYNIKVVEVIGGSSRIPAIKKRVKNVFGIDPTSTLNADEVVALGCTLQSAFLSPSFKVVRKLKVIDYQPYQINAQYYHESRSDLKKYSISPFFEKGCTIPFTKQVILTCHELPMVFDFDYINDSGESCSFGKFRIYSKENLTFSPSKMKVRLRIDDNGLIQVSSAQLEIEDPNAVEDSSKPKEEGEENSKKIKAVDLEHEIIWLKGFLTDDKLDKLRNFESDLVLADKNLNERIDSKNALEEFIYKWRDQIEREEFHKFINSDSKRIFINELKENEKWLLDDEDNCELQSKTIYLERLNQLKKYSDKIINGIKEVNDKKELYQILNNMINNLEREPKDLTESFKNNNAHYLYKNTKNFIPDTQTWINENSAKSVKNEFDEDPQFSYSVLQDKLELLKECFSVFEKNYEETKAKLEEEAKKAKEEKMETENKNNEEAKAANDTKEKTEMEVDSN